MLTLSGQASCPATGAVGVGIAGDGVLKPPSVVRRIASDVRVKLPATTSVGNGVVVGAIRSSSTSAPSVSHQRTGSGKLQPQSPLASSRSSGAAANSQQVRAAGFASPDVGAKPGAEQQSREETVPERGKYAVGFEVHINEHRFRCLNILGRGSYSEVWRAEVVAGSATGTDEVALKEVHCTNQSDLQQAIFEVQVLFALQRSVPAGAPSLRVPQCIGYKVEPCDDGFNVCMAMTVVPGESLDNFIRRPAPYRSTPTAAIRRACALAARLLLDIGHTLQLLAPIAWHRDVNSHNILLEGAPDDELCKNSRFWLIDFGLAVDSQSWVTSAGRWRTEFIGGDSRYWPPSSWMMHLLGPEGFEGQDNFCQQYQWRLDVHGLGITALELLCSVMCPKGTDIEEYDTAWLELLRAWSKYRADVWQWWAAVYEVYSTGGDVAPVQAQLLKDRIIDKHVVLLAELRRALRLCAALPDTERSAGHMLRVIADMIDENLTFDLAEIGGRLGEATVSNRASSATAPPAGRGSRSSAASQVQPCVAGQPQQPWQPQQPRQQQQTQRLPQQSPQHRVPSSSLSRQRSVVAVPGTPGIGGPCGCAGPAFLAAPHASARREQQSVRQVNGRSPSPIRAAAPPSPLPPASRQLPFASVPMARGTSPVPVRPMSPTRERSSYAAPVVNSVAAPPQVVTPQTPAVANAAPPRRSLNVDRPPDRSLSPTRAQNPLVQRWVSCATLPSASQASVVRGLRGSLSAAAPPGSTSSGNSVFSVASPVSSSCAFVGAGASSSSNSRVRVQRSYSPGPGMIPSSHHHRSPRPNGTMSPGTGAPFLAPLALRGSRAELTGPRVVIPPVQHVQQFSSEVDPGAATPYSVAGSGVSSCGNLAAATARKAHADEEHEKLRARIRHLEESLQKLGRDSIERATFGVDRLVDACFSQAASPQLSALNPGDFVELIGLATATVYNGRQAVVLQCDPSTTVAQIRLVDDGSLQTIELKHLRKVGSKLPSAQVSGGSQTSIYGGYAGWQPSATSLPPSSVSSVALSPGGPLLVPKPVSAGVNVKGVGAVPPPLALGASSSAGRLPQARPGYHHQTDANISRRTSSSALVGPSVAGTHGFQVATPRSNGAEAVSRGAATMRVPSPSR